MPHTIHSRFVQSIADDFYRRYPTQPAIIASHGALWIKCRSDSPSRLRSTVAFGISPDCVTVAFEGLAHPFVAVPAVRDAETVRRLAFGLFDDLITERQVAISYWISDECISVEFIPHDQIRVRHGAWNDSGANRIRVRSWLGTYDYDSAT